MSNLVISGLDSPVAFDSTQLSYELDSLMERALLEKNVELVLNAGLNLRKATELGNFGIAKLAYELKKVWRHFEVGAEFEDVIFEWWGLHKTTQERYIRVWEMRMSGDVPPQLLDTLSQRPLDDQIKISTAWAAGFEIKEEQFEELAEAENSARVNEILRDIKGAEPRTNSLRISLKRTGDLYVYPGANSQGFFIGYLDMDSENEAVRRAVTRIINSARILED